MEKQSVESASPADPDADVFRPRGAESTIGFLELDDSSGAGQRSAEPPSLALHNDLDIRNHWCGSTRAIKIAILRQPHSWDPLDVTRDVFQCLVEKTDAMDDVRDVVLSFRSKIRNLDRGFAPCAWRQRASVHEISYVFKYPEQKLNDEGEMIWSIRQTGLYQRYDLAKQRSAWFVVLPNYDSCNTEQLVEIMGKGKHPLQSHVEFLSLRLRNWRWYIRDFEKRCQESAEMVLNVEIEERFDFVDMYDQLSGLRFVETNISCLLPVFAAHQRVLGRLKQWNSAILESGRVDRSTAVEFSADLESIEARIQGFESNARFLLSRCASTIQMASDTIILKSQNATESISTHMLRDSSAMRVITVVTLIFLPTAFTSGFFGMGFFTTDPDAGGRWVVAPYLWLYFALTIPLTIMTLLFWRWRSRRERIEYSNSSPV